MRSVIAVLGTAALTSTTACVTREASRAPITARDSAGVEIVEVDSAVLKSLPAWHVDSEPLTIGDARGAEEYMLHRATQPWTLDDGRIAVANDQHEIRFYDSAGRYLTRVGRRGKGPGEYTQLWSLARLPADTLLAADPANARVTLLDSDGRVLGSYTMLGEYSVPPSIQWLPDRSAVYFDGRIERLFAPNAQDRTGVAQDSAWLIRLAPGAVSRDTITRVPGHWYNIVGGWFSRVALSGDLILAVGAQIVVGHGATFALDWYDDSGRLTRSTRVALAPRAVTDADIAAYKSATRRPAAGELSEGGPRMEAYAKYVPVISRALIDRAGLVWVRRWVGPTTRDVECIIFEQEGRPAARITLPAALTVSDIGTDYILGIHRDDDAVQTVRRYHLHRYARQH